jgi:hypothetical protein
MTRTFVQALFARVPVVIYPFTIAGSFRNWS